MKQHIDCIFLASRFGEFLELRSKLREKINLHRTPQLKAIDLNDGSASACKPIDECLIHVKKSDFFILLLGDTYGSIPDGYDKSYTNIEYEEAFANEFGTTILVFCIGDSYVGSKIEYSNDERMRAWQKQVESRHTLVFFEKPTNSEDMDAIVKDIYIELLKNIHSKYLEQSDIEISWNELDDEEIFDDEEEIENFEIILNPGLEKENDLRSTEQKLYDLVTSEGPYLEAYKAIAYGDRKIAVHILREILSKRPYDVRSNVVLARLYLATNNKVLFGEAKEMLIRAAEESVRNNKQIRASYCFQLAALCSEFLGRAAEALEFAEKAVETYDYAKAYIARAKYRLASGDIQDAMKDIIKAHSKHPTSVLGIKNDPAFSLIRKDIDKYLLEHKDKVLKILAEMRSAGSTIHYGDNINTFNDKTIAQSSKKYIGEILDILRGIFQRAEICRFDLNDDDENISAIKYVQYTDDYFNAKNVEISALYIKEGDILSHGTKLFDFRYIKDSGERSNALVSREWRKNNDAIVFRVNKSEKTNPNKLFSYVDTKTKIIPQSKKSILEAEKKKLNNHIMNLELENDRETKRMGVSIFASLVLAIFISLTIKANMIAGLAIVIFVIFATYTVLSSKKNIALHLTKIQSLRGAVEEVDTQLNGILEHFVANKDKFINFLTIFENEILSKAKYYPRLLPFSALKTSKIGDLVRVDKDILQRSESEGYKIVVLNDFPEWLEIPNTDSQIGMVLERGGGEIVISRYRAYKSINE